MVLHGEVGCGVNCDMGIMLLYNGEVLKFLYKLWQKMYLRELEGHFFPEQSINISKKSVHTQNSSSLGYMSIKLVMVSCPPVIAMID